MKRLIPTFVLLFLSLLSDAQTSPIKTKTFFWGDSEKVFYEQLTESGKSLLDSCFKIIQVDTVNCVRLTSDDQINYTNREYLSKHDYQYVTMYKYENALNIRKYPNNISLSDKPNKKVLLRYSKDEENKIDKITIHVID